MKSLIRSATDLSNAGSREAHQNQKVLRQERKSNKAGFEVITDAKKVWEKLRRGDIKRDEKQKLMKEIMELIEGRVGDVSFLEKAYEEIVW